MIDIELMRSVTKALRSRTRIQMLCAAVLGLERTWQIFLDWTRNESAPLLRRHPEEYRKPFRRALDLLVEQVKNEQIYNEHPEIFEELYRFEQSSYDEEDAQDVDYGNACFFIDAMTSSGISAFFPIEPEKREEFPWNQPDFYEKEAAELVVLYADILYSFLYDDCAEDEHSAIEASIARSPLWLAETERIKSDLALVREYPKNKETVLRRIAEYRELRTEPFFTE